MPIPNDPVILLSFINTKLRDEYSSLDSLTRSLQIDKPELIDKLQKIGYEYNLEQNRFI